MSEQEAQKLKPLSPKHQVFVNKYLELWNGTRAYMEAYPGTKEPTARTNGSILLATPNIRTHIDARLSEMHMSAEEALSRMAEMAKGNIADFIDTELDANGMPRGWDINLFDVVDGKVVPKYQTRNIKKLKRKVTKDVMGNETVHVEVELYSAADAQEKILRLHGRFGDVPTPQNTTAGALISLPADSIAPSFFGSYRAVKSGLYDEYLEEGGRGSAKSSYVSEQIIELLVNNPTYHAIAMRQYASTLRDSVFNQFIKSIELLGLTDKFKTTVSPLEITYIPTGQKIYFRGADDPVKIKSISPTFGYIALRWFEEIDQFYGPGAIRTIEQSFRGGDKSYTFKTWNTPRTRASWITKYVQIPKARQWHHKSDYRDVPVEWLGRSWLDEAEHLKSVAPKLYDHEYLGVASGSDGLVFDNVEIRTITDEEINTFNQPEDGIDWGFYPDPFVWGRSYYNPAQLVIYIYDEMVLYKHGNREAYDKLIQAGKLLPDVQIIADSAEPKSVADFRDYGANIRGAEKGPGTVDYSIKWMASRAKIVIDPVRCPVHADEFLNYELEQTKDGEYITAYPDKNNHCIDRTRYAHNLTWRKRGM
jgi:PBSX family phage terminase large subunit